MEVYRIEIATIDHLLDHESIDLMPIGDDVVNDIVPAE